MIGDSTTTTLQYYCAETPHLLTTLQPKEGDHVLLNASMSPTRITSQSPAVHLVRGTLQDHQPSFWWDAEKYPCFHSITSILSNADAASTSKSSIELMQEITTLEVEILQLERYLLSLYRTAFQQHHPVLMGGQGTLIEDKMRSHMQATDNRPCFEMDRAISRSDSNHHHQILPSNALACSNYHIKAATKSPSRRVDKLPLLKGKPQADSAHHSLADHLGSYLMDDALDCPTRLSEEIVRCICCIYCKFANPALPQKGLFVSSTSSFSSSSTFSPGHISGSWSPSFNEGSKGYIEDLKDDTGPYAATIEVIKICLDDDTFQYVARVLEKFRSLVKSLEKVDPRNMKREEKLAFWLNIHNALVMHGYLAYGTQNFVRSSSILKAAYNVGGQCINAHVIQNSILGIRSHYSAPWLQTLLSPKKKFTIGSAKHTYSLEYPEPLVHFALCSGSCSDPPVRVFTAKNVFQDLKVARDEFIQASVYIQRETKLYLPKLVCYFAREMSLSMSGLLEMICACLPEVQQKAIRTCIKGRADKYIHWIPQSSTFRYLIHQEVVQGNKR
ncbi:hypothetical protein ACH5RR_027631 [Cinchona calisaya]|uniref:DUF547 domain-containing protein n=1 Tax=Cinchona calisaya TaxID=153742 RepID=A0ABD2Z7S7_9GENT